MPGSLGRLALIATNVVLVAALVGGDATERTGAAASPQRPPGATCYGEAAALTVEEQRLTAPLPGDDVPAAQRFTGDAGFDRLLDRFHRRMCQVPRLGAATTAVRAAGEDLWRSAVQRAQGQRPLGTADAYDDRGLYWARLTMTRALREWQPSFDLTSIQRQALIRILDRASRGVDDVAFGAGDDVTRVLVSGFDTFSLDASLRNSNPSGASALQLDGLVVDTPDGRVAVQAVMLPVNWTDFDQGIVEDAFGPHLVSDDPVEMIMTISQTGRGRMDVEKWAGAGRGGNPDNNRSLNFGQIPASPTWPQPQPSPQWIETTLPFQAMIDAGTGPWPVQLNDGVCEWPAGTYPDPGSVRCRPDPSEGSTAASAPGGSYLSNESMYRTNRLRLAAGLPELPGGHLHISSLVYPDDPAATTSPEFETDRRAVVDQTVALVAAAGAAVASGTTSTEEGSR